MVIRRPMYLKRKRRKGSQKIIIGGDVAMKRKKINIGRKRRIEDAEFAKEKRNQ